MSYWATVGPSGYPRGAQKGPFGLKHTLTDRKASERPRNAGFGPNCHRLVWLGWNYGNHTQHVPLYGRWCMVLACDARQVMIGRWRTAGNAPQVMCLHFSTLFIPYPWNTNLTPSDLIQTGRVFSVSEFIMKNFIFLIGTTNGVGSNILMNW